MITIKKLNIEHRLYIENLELQTDKLTFILGENGAGKSTFLKAIGGLLKADEENIYLNNRPLGQMTLPELARIRGWLGQEQSSIFDMSASSMLSFFCDERLFDNEHYWLKRLNLVHLYQQKLSTLSGGEKQRIFILRVLLQVQGALNTGNALLLLDEPNSGLDLRHQKALLELLCELVNEGNQIILSSHNPSLAMHYADDILLLKDGQLINRLERNSTDKVTALAHCYGLTPEDFSILG